MYHSDIKPDNIMMDQHDNIFLIDTDSFHQKKNEKAARTPGYTPFI